MDISSPCDFCSKPTWTSSDICFRCYGKISAFIKKKRLRDNLESELDKLELQFNKLREDKEHNPLKAINKLRRLKLLLFSN